MKLGGVTVSWRCLKRCLAIVLALFLMFGEGVIFSVSAEEEAGVEQVISWEFYSFSSSVDVSEFMITPEELSRVFSLIIKNDPYLFFVDNTLSYSFDSRGYVLSVKPNYSMEGKEVFAAWDFCREVVRSMARGALKYETDEAKALYLHDYICSNYSYDTTLANDDLYSFFLTGQGSCQSYAYAYMAALRECGIESRFVASDSISHMWNYVNIDGEWYHVDLTWDDAGSEVSRRHFLCSDKTARARGHKDWYSTEETVCASEKYSVCNLDALLHSDFESGDVDHSGCVDLGDALSVRGYLSDDTFSGFCLFCADADGNGIVDGADVEFLRKKLLQLD